MRACPVADLPRLRRTRPLHPVLHEVRRDGVLQRVRDGTLHVGHTYR